MDIIPLAGLNIRELEELLSPLPRFRAGQIYKWITRAVSGFDQMTDIPAAMKTELKKRFRLYSGAPDGCYEDGDTKKIAVTLKDGLKIEAVLLSDGKKRLTACLSTQAGCPIKCVFCKTGSLGFKRNLECGEIIEQFLFLRSTQRHKGTKDTKEDKGKKTNERAIDNIVIMGMGEPLLNLEQLRKAIAIFTDPSGMNISRRRITVSTCGIADGLFDLAENGPYIRLALSLTTADEELRGKLMPGTAAGSLQKVKEAVALYQKNGGGRVTLEIPLLGGINTREKDALSVAAFADGLETVVNIIPWNPVAGLGFDGRPLAEPDKKETGEFITKLESLGLKVTTRYRKGRGVCGACGQLGQ
jgi:23S rRNA (adenine2503-C2)-methyltransferase